MIGSTDTTFAQLDRILDRQFGIEDAQAALAGMPAEVLPRSWSRAIFADTDEVRLTLRGVAASANSQDDLELLVTFLRWAADRERRDEAEQIQVSSLEFADFEGLALEPAGVVTDRAVPPALHQVADEGESVPLVRCPGTFAGFKGSGSFGSGSSPAVLAFAADPGAFAALGSQDIRVTGVGVAPPQVVLHGAGQGRVVRMVRVRHREHAQRPELGLDRVRPGRAGRRQAQLDLVAGRPDPDRRRLVGRQVVQDDVARGTVRPGLADGLSADRV